MICLISLTLSEIYLHFTVFQRQHQQLSVKHQNHIAFTLKPQRQIIGAFFCNYWKIMTYFGYPLFRYNHPLSIKQVLILYQTNKPLHTNIIHTPKQKGAFKSSSLLIRSDDRQF